MSYIAKMDEVKNKKHKLIELYKNPNAFKRHLPEQTQRGIMALTNSKQMESSTRIEPENTRNITIKEKKRESILEAQYKLEARYTYDLLLDKMFENFVAPCENQMEHIKIPTHALKIKKNSSQYIGIGLKNSFIKPLENQIKISKQNQENRVSQMEISELDDKNTDDTFNCCANSVKTNDFAGSNAIATPDDSLLESNEMLSNFGSDVNNAPADTTQSSLVLSSDSHKGNTIENCSNHSIALLNDSTKMKREKEFESASNLNAFLTETNPIEIDEVIEIDSCSSINGSVSDRIITLLDDNSFKMEIDSEQEYQSELNENDYIEDRLPSSLIQTNSAAHESMESNTFCLTLDQEKAVHSVFKGFRNDVIIKKFKIEILRSDIKRLCENEWLNDKIINFYMNLIAEHSNNSQMNLTTYALDSFLMSRYMEKGYEAVKRWTRKVDIFAYDIILIPINIHSTHWVLGVINLKNKFIHYYDSMEWGRLPFNLAYLTQYLQSESLDKRHKSINLNEFSISKATNIPQQSNCIDCGVFICLFANLIRQNKELNFTQKDIPFYRKRMVYEILKGQLMQ